MKRQCSGCGKFVGHNTNANFYTDNEGGPNRRVGNFLCDKCWLTDLMRTIVPIGPVVANTIPINDLFKLFDSSKEEFLEILVSNGLTHDAARAAISHLKDFNRKTVGRGPQPTFGDKIANAKT